MTPIQPRVKEGTTITVPSQEPGPAPRFLSRRLSELLASPDLLRPVFQPILSVADGSVVGHEGFSRFGIGLQRAPEPWFAEATNAGLGAEFQALAIRRILGVAAQVGLPAGTFLSLNVSPRFLAHPAIVAAVGTADLSRLVVEFTEEEAVGNYSELRRAMDPYLRRGVRFAVDDAGAGFAFMRHVIELRPSFVKLDAYLIRDMRNRQTLQAFLRAINGFTTEIGATLVAEGVETAADLAVLTETGFPILAQGFGIARPSRPWPDVTSAARRAWHAASQNRSTPSRRARAHRTDTGSSARIPIDVVAE